MPQLQGSPAPILTRVLSPLRMHPQGAGPVKMPEELLEHPGVEPALCWLSPYPYRKQKITELKIILILNSPTVKEKGKIPFIRQIPLQSSGMMSRGML